MGKFQLILTIGMIVLLMSCKVRSDKFYMPAEWEPHDAVWLGWSKNTKRGYHPVVADIIKSVSPTVKVKIAFDSDSLMQTARKRLSLYGIDTTMYKTYIMPGDRYWIRDYGAVFLVNEKGDLGVANFSWNSYGYPGF